tara:strand:+ start:11191 stop:11397 length:207 start_codon:yes stop_codon:yes gene_type:complete
MSAFSAEEQNCEQAQCEQEITVTKEVTEYSDKDMNQVYDTTENILKNIGREFGREFGREVAGEIEAAE